MTIKVESYKVIKLSRPIFSQSCFRLHPSSLYNLRGGYALIPVIVFASIAVAMLTSLSGWAGLNIRLSREAESREQALQIAEAGIEYYRWHLAHAPADFKDGTGAPGPYIHAFYDKDAIRLGEFRLTITAPPIGSTVVTIRSEGRVDAVLNLYRTIEAKMAISSLAKYSVVANEAMRFGSGTEIFGPVHSNGGIRFDGLSHNVVTSALSSYDDPDHTGGNEFGVHTHISPTDPLPPSATPNRPDVFMAGRQFPVPAFDFTGLTSDLSSIKSSAQSGGRYFASSGGLGYKILLKTDDTFDLYRVNNLRAVPSGCSSSGQSGWGTWSIGTAGNSQTLLGNYAFPANGLVFVEDHLWVEGQIAGARLTIASGKFPASASTRTSITVNNDILYTTKDGSDVLSLIAQNNLNVGLYSEDNLEIDAALVAQNGRVGRYYYGSSCSSNYIRSVLTLYGMIATSQRYGFAYTDGTGYQTRNLNYDANLLYGPPPSFPLTTDQYTILSWQEIK